jgi:hypothetical protein
MPKGRTYDTHLRLTPVKKEMHPIWRGVGFAFMILIPVISVSAALLLIAQNEKNKWIVIPKDMLFNGKDPLLFIKIILSVVLILVLYAFFTMITFLVNRFFGPPRYGPYDIPAAKFNKRKR